MTATPSATDSLPTELDVLDFWWRAGRPKWFAKDEGFDRAVADQFWAVHREACAGRLDHWADHPAGMLALIIVLDQFSRNLFRDDARAFDQDAKALELTLRALDAGFDRAYPEDGKAFMAMPLMHAEDIGCQQRGVDYFHGLGLKENHYFALIHMDIIRRFGRFPHRNECLGRETTPEEAAFLAAGNFSG